MSSLNSTPSSERIHIGFFGLRNAGKSSVVNSVTGQEISIVSDVKGTTTDPVTKAMELLPLGPVQIIDTPGIDDEGFLGELRVRKTKQILNRTDIAILVTDITSDITETEKELITIFKEKKLPYVVVLNKSDLLPAEEIPVRTAQIINSLPSTSDGSAITVSAITGEGIHELKEIMARLTLTDGPELRIVGDLISPEDFVVLVVPIDSAAPKGRLILPQQQTIRDVLESGAASIVVRDSELKATLEALGKKPSLVITDSQVFDKVSKDTPGDIPLTSFSILFARYKGDLAVTAKGAAAIDNLKDGDTVLISEGCSHHRQCDDIGSVKIPAWLKKYTGKELNIELSSGREFPEDLSKYSLIIHCGGCMLRARDEIPPEMCS